MKWQWANRHRQHREKIYFDIPKAGTHVVTISMREDGCELDQFVLTSDENWTPPADEGPIAPTVPTELNGLLVVEAEDLLPAPGWELRTNPTGHTGTGYIAWTFPGQGRAPGEGVLRLQFRITTPGDYQFLWHSRMVDPTNRPETLDADGNDTWIRFLSGTDSPGQFALGAGWRKVALLGHPPGWSWSTHADQGPPHPDIPVSRRFEAGLHTVELSGRSQGHLIDRLVLRRFDERITLSSEEEELLRTSMASPVL